MGRKRAVNIVAFKKDSEHDGKKGLRGLENTSTPTWGEKSSQGKMNMVMEFPVAPMRDDIWCMIRRKKNSDREGKGRALRIRNSRAESRGPTLSSEDGVVLWGIHCQRRRAGST